MKLSSAATQRFLKSPDPAISIILLYGPDHGLVAERASVLERNHLGENVGPFAQSVLTSSDIKNDPACLQDGICALALGGGARSVRLKAGTDQAVATTLKSLLETLDNKEIVPAALLLVEAGDLNPRSALRKLVENDKKNAVTIACYAPNLSDLRALAEEQAQACVLRFDQGALDVLVNQLPQDRALARSEINKLMLYAAQNDGGVITSADINTILADSINQSLDAFGAAIADGAYKEADRLLSSALTSGQSSIALVRAVQRYLLRLIEAKAALDGGADINSAMKGLRPPVFFAHQSRFSRHLGAWSAPALRRALGHCLDTERAMKSSGAIPENLLARLVIKLCSGKK